MAKTIKFYEHEVDYNTLISVGLKRLIELARQGNLPNMLWNDMSGKSDNMSPIFFALKEYLGIKFNDTKLHNDFIRRFEDLGENSWLDFMDFNQEVLKKFSQWLMEDK